MIRVLWNLKICLYMLDCKTRFQILCDDYDEVVAFIKFCDLIKIQGVPN